MTIATLDDARRHLTTHGLHVSDRPDSLFIMATWEESSGFRVSQDASMIIRSANRWVAALPDYGTRYDVVGELPELVELVELVYERYRAEGGRFEGAVRKVLQEQGRLGNDTVSIPIQSGLMPQAAEGTIP